MTKETIFNAAAGMAVATLSFGAIWAAGQPIAAEESSTPAVSAPAIASPAAAAPAKSPDGKAVTVEELKAMLSRKETPRVTVVNKFGGKATGKALRIEAGDLKIDTSSEGVGVEGVLGIPLSGIVSIRVLPLIDQKDADVSSRATRDYLKRVGQPPVPAVAKGVSTESSLSVASTDSAIGAGSSTESAITAAGSIGSTEAALDETQVDYLALYPPKEGWGPRKLGEIRRKAVVLGLAPFGKDKTFLKDYDAWKKAYEVKRNMQLEEQAAMQGMGQTPPDGFAVLPELEETPVVTGASDSPVGDSSDERPAGHASTPVGDSAADAPTGDTVAPAKKAFGSTGSQLSGK